MPEEQNNDCLWFGDVWRGNLWVRTAMPRQEPLFRLYINAWRGIAGLLLRRPRNHQQWIWRGGQGIEMK